MTNRASQKGSPEVGYAVGRASSLDDDPEDTRHVDVVDDDVVDVVVMQAFCGHH